MDGSQDKMTAGMHPFHIRIAPNHQGRQQGKKETKGVDLKTAKQEKSQQTPSENGCLLLPHPS